MFEYTPNEETQTDVQRFLDTLEVYQYDSLQVVDHDLDRCQCPRYPHYCTSWVTRKFYILPYASFGEYDGSTAEQRSNARLLKEMFGFVTSYGVGYGEYTGIDEPDISLIDADSLQALQETCKALSNYRCIDEDDVYRVEMELRDEAWSNWVERDFRQALLNHQMQTRGLTDDQADEFETRIDALSSEQLRELLEKAAQEANEDWVIEGGGNAYINLDRVVEHVDFE